MVLATDQGIQYLQNSSESLEESEENAAGHE